MRRWWRIVVLAAAAVCLMAGCRREKLQKGEEETGLLRAGKTFVFGDTTFNPENQEPDVNPHREYSGWACIRYGIGETLFRYTDEMVLEPWLAESYERVDDLTWRITLKEGIFFTSGRRLDGEAVKECLERLIQENDRAREELKIAAITAEGQRITIKTIEPKPSLLNGLSDPYGCIFDVEAGITEEGIVQGTGPYRAVSLASGQQLKLVKNENYWNGNPKIDEITVLSIPDGDTLTMALQSGEIDAAYGVPYASYPLFENQGYNFSSCATSRTFFLQMNFDSSVIQDPAVRQAIAMGINKEGFVNALLQGKGYVAWGPFPSNFPFGGEQEWAKPYDPEQAKKLLEEAGWSDTDGDGIREKEGKDLIIRWLTYPSRQELPILAESAQAMLKELGIQVQINSTVNHNMIRMDSSQWDVYASAMVTAPTGDPEYFFTACCLDRSAANHGHYHNDELEDLADELAVTFDEGKRGELAEKMQQIILEDDGYVFCSHLQMSIISQAKVTGLKAYPCDYYEITAELDILQE